ncbi:30062_t:CDS:2 [Racocetra persica]|uniref:30062_t:CDS:1 n=1 Tax=Racocetra persica TaxID=160502 RepID=A0ACA9MSG5_9GLOM|nr:30062_t:CDS:2 [Racocetra persica]
MKENSTKTSYYTFTEKQRAESASKQDILIHIAKYCQQPIRKNDHFILNDFEVINLDNVKKYYKEILLCKTYYHTQFEELEINDPKAEEYYKKEGINKLTECNFCCKPIRKRQGYKLWNTGQYMCCLEEMIAFMVYAEITDRPTYHTHQRIYHRTRYGVYASKSINESKIYSLIALIKEEKTLLDKKGILKQYNHKTILLQEKKNEPITDQDIILEPEEINNKEQDQVIADIATQNLDYDYKPKELDAKK